ncbi:hypothetical protein T492DRAFT_458420 [Pavlovales sp. CCMP2436]|nr:hypothetical protein T492DRAFT_458420 [Pavlovales sp. CCMP2436]
MHAQHNTWQLTFKPCVWEMIKMRPPREQQLIAYDCLKVLKDARITVMLPKRRTPDNSIECPKFRGQDLHKVSRTSLPLPDLTFTSPPYPAVSHDRHDVAGIRSRLRCTRGNRHPQTRGEHILWRRGRRNRRRRKRRRRCEA